MSEGQMSPMEQVLRLCAHAAPQPWYPRVFVRQTGVSKNNLSLIIEDLLLDGLVERTPNVEDDGPGLVLTPLGSRILQDDAALARLREGLPAQSTGRSAIVREALRGRVVAHVTRLLLALNFLVFGYGIYLAVARGNTSAYLTGQPGDRVSTYRPFVEVLQRCGSINAEEWLRGEWWRSLSACFVHIGVLHLLLNMYMLYIAGSFIEQMWGRARYLVIYLIGGVVGSCVGLAHQTVIIKLSDVQPPEYLCGPLAGASTALCGILAAEAIWVVLNAKYLPRSLFSRWRNNLLIQGALILFISLFPGVSGWGHFGGAVGGGLAAVLLHFHRFGPRPLRWLALVCVLPLPFLGLLEVQRMRRCREDVTLNLRVVPINLCNTGWGPVELLDYQTRTRPRDLHAPHIETRLFGTQAIDFLSLVQPLLNMDPARRIEQKQAATEQALNYLDKEQTIWRGYLEIVDRAGPYYQPGAQEAQAADRTAIEDHLQLFVLAEKCLHAGKSWSAEDDATLREAQAHVNAGDWGRAGPVPPAPHTPDEIDTFNREFVTRVQRESKKLASVWQDADMVRQELPGERRPGVAEKLVPRLKAERARLNELSGLLATAGPYKDPDVEKARLAARDYLRAYSSLLEMTERCLAQGERWTKEDTAQLEEQRILAEKNEAAWLSLLAS